MRSVPYVLATLALAMLGSSANAQTSADTLATGAPVQPGATAPTPQRVRLTMSRETLRTDGRYIVVGTLVDANETRAIVQQDRRQALDTVQMFTVAKVERYDGERERPKLILAGAAGGAGLALILRGVANLTSGGRCQTKCDTPLIPGYVYAVPVAVGALIGLVCPSTRWVEVNRANLALGARSRHQLQLSSSINFR